MSDVICIGRYQLENLQKNRVGFLFLDLSEQPKPHELLIGSQAVSATEALAFVSKQGAKPDTPIVLICETGAISMEVARELEAKSFINVFVIEGGFEGMNADGTE